MLERSRKAGRFICTFVILNLNIYGFAAVVWRRDNLVNNEYTTQDIEDYVVQPVNIVGRFVQDCIVLRQIKD